MLGLMPSMVVWAQELIDFKQLNLQIEEFYKAKDTTALAEIYSNKELWAEEKNNSSSYSDFLNFKLRHAQYLSAYSKVDSDSIIQIYEQIHKEAGLGQHHMISAQALGKLATTYRSKRRLDKAFEFNQKEIRAARLSRDPKRLGSSLVTELDIAYNSLPWPVQSGDLDDLVIKSEFVIEYARTNNLPFILSFGKLYLSKFYIKQEEYLKSETILHSISDTSPISISFSKYEHLCEIAKETNSLEKYRTYTLEFKKRAYQTKRAFVALNAHNYLLDYSNKTNNTDSAGYYASLLERNLKEVDTTKYLDFLDVSYTTLAEYFKGRDTKKVLQYMSYSAEVNKIIADRQKEAFTSILRYKSELNQLEVENTELTNKNHWFKANFWRLIGISIILLTTLFFLYKKYKQSRSRVAVISEEKELLEETVSLKYIELHNKQHVYLHELKYIKADRNYVELYTDSKRYVDRNVLSSLLKSLPPNFVQVHRSYVINKNFIKSSSSHFFILKPDIEIPLSRTYKSRLSDRL